MIYTLELVYTASNMSSVQSISGRSNPRRRANLILHYLTPFILILTGFPSTIVEEYKTKGIAPLTISKILQREMRLKR